MNITHDVAVRWLAAFNAHDLDTLLGLYAEDAQHYSPKLKIRQPETGGLIAGKAALRAWWADAFARLPTLQYDPTAITADADQVFMEYIRRVSGEPPMPVAEVLRITDGLIAASSVYHG